MSSMTRKVFILRFHIICLSRVTRNTYPVPPHTYSYSQCPHHTSEYLPYLRMHISIFNIPTIPPYAYFYIQYTHHTSVASIIYSHAAMAPCILSVVLPASSRHLFESNMFVHHFLRLMPYSMLMSVGEELVHCTEILTSGHFL